MDAVPAAPSEDRGPTTISEIRHESSDRSTRIAVDCTGPVAYTYYSPDPLTLVVEDRNLVAGDRARGENHEIAFRQRHVRMLVLGDARHGGAGLALTARA